MRPRVEDTPVSATTAAASSVQPEAGPWVSGRAALERGAGAQGGRAVDFGVLSGRIPQGASPPAPRPAGRAGGARAEAGGSAGAKAPWASASLSKAPEDFGAIEDSPAKKALSDSTLQSQARAPRVPRAPRAAARLASS